MGVRPSARRMRHRGNGHRNEGGDREGGDGDEELQHGGTRRHPRYGERLRATTGAGTGRPPERNAQPSSSASGGSHAWSSLSTGLRAAPAVRAELAVGAVVLLPVVLLR